MQYLGHFGVSKRTVAEAACEAVQEFNKYVISMRSITDVRFVNIDIEVDELFKRTFESSQRNPATRQFQLSFCRPKFHIPHTEISEVSESVANHRRRERKLAKTRHKNSVGRHSPSDEQDDGRQERQHVDDLNHHQVSQRLYDVHTKVDASDILVDISEPPTNNSTALTADGQGLSIENTDGQNCVICMDVMTKPCRLLCGHFFCSECILRSFDQCGAKCPSCGRLYGVQRGNQPPGTMTHTIDFSKQLAGYHG